MEHQDDLTTASPAPSEETPVNGLKGLKHWRHDIVAGLVVSLVSLPLSLGIAVASGAPPVCGLISSIIAGLVFPFLGGANVTISGPAAGLAPVVLSSILTLGHGNAGHGYHLVLVAIFLTGCLQILSSHLKAARLSAMLPSAAIEGMLAAIGLLIIGKQIPNFLGEHFKAHEFFPILFELPSRLAALDPKVFIVSAICPALLVTLSSFKNAQIKLIPPQLIAVIVGAALGSLIGLDQKFLISVPDNILHGITYPDFHAFLKDKSLWWPLFTCVLTLAFVDGFESLATIMAIDKIDPFKRKSDPDRTLFAMGTSNICSSLFGGLTIIPGGIKSTTCILAGGRTLWANFYNAIFLLLFLLLARPFINAVPLGVLAAVLVHIGYKLCGPKKWKQIAALGPRQLFIFTATVVTTLCTDLLIGLICGTVIKLLFALSAYHRAVQLNGQATSLMQSLKALFANPVAWQGNVSNVYRVNIRGPVVCFNALHISRELTRLQTHQGPVHIHFFPESSFLDQTSLSNLVAFAQEYKRTGRGDVRLFGIEQLAPESHLYALDDLYLNDRKQSA